MPTGLCVSNSAPVPALTNTNDGQLYAGPRFCPPARAWAWPWRWPKPGLQTAAALSNGHRMTILRSILAVSEPTYSSSKTGLVRPKVEQISSANSLTWGDGVAPAPDTSSKSSAESSRRIWTLGSRHFGASLKSTMNPTLGSRPAHLRAKPASAAPPVFRRFIASRCGDSKFSLALTSAAKFRVCHSLPISWFPQK